MTDTLLPKPDEELPAPDTQLPPPPGSLPEPDISLPPTSLPITDPVTPTQPLPYHKKSPLLFILPILLIVLVVTCLALIDISKLLKKSPSIEPILPKADLQSQCETNLGRWLVDYSECEKITESTCLQLGGSFTECGSACRHKDAENCAEVCIPFCQFTQTVTDELCPNCPMYAPPPPDWCSTGTILPPENVTDVLAGCYCPGPATCSTDLTPAPSISTSPTQPTTTIPADWQTYTNTKYGFSFKYPPNYILTDRFQLNEIKNPSNTCYGTYNSVHLRKNVYVNEAQNPAIDIYAVSTNKTVTDYVNDCRINTLAGWRDFCLEGKLNCNSEDDPKIIESSKATNGPLSATKILATSSPNAPNNQYTQFIFKRGNTIYVLSSNYGTFNPDFNDSGDNEKLIISDIFNSFAFQ